MKTFVRFTFFSVFAAAGILVSCKKNKPIDPPEPDDQLIVRVYPMFGTDSLYLDSTYVTQEGYGVKFTDIKFFANDWKYNDNYLVNAALFDYRETGHKFVHTIMDPALFPGVDGFLGITQSMNHADPTAFPSESPLNIVNAGGMHWGWNPGYIFIKVEAKVDTIPDGTDLFDHSAVYHVGTDAFLQTLNFPAITWNNYGDHIFLAKMKLDMNQFLVNGTQTINLKTEYITHSGAGQEALSQKAIANFKSALSFIN